MKALATIRLLAMREYAPWIGLLLCWVIIVAAVGVAHAALLFAAWAFVRSVRNLTTASVLMPLRRRVPRQGEVSRQALRAAALVQLLTLFAGALVLALMIAIMIAARQALLAQLCLLLAIALPPRYLMPLAASRRVFPYYRFAAAWVGVALVLVTWLLAPSVKAMAIAFAARDWAALALCLAAAPRIRGKKRPWGPLEWREIAVTSAELSRRRLTYRLGKGVLSALLGPAGSLAARTGRGLRLHRRLHEHMPDSLVPTALFALVAVASAVALLMLWPGPVGLVIAGSLTMVAAVAANALLWSGFATRRSLLEDDDEVEE